MSDIIAAALVSCCVYALFAAEIAIVLLHGIPAGSERIADVVLGLTGTMATSVTGYWIGSSRGSAKKTDLLANSVPVDTRPPA